MIEYKAKRMNNVVPIIVIIVEHEIYILDKNNSKYKNIIKYKINQKFEI